MIKIGYGSYGRKEKSNKITYQDIIRERGYDGGYNVKIKQDNPPQPRIVIRKTEVRPEIKNDQEELKKEIAELTKIRKNLREARSYLKELRIEWQDLRIRVMINKEEKTKFLEWIQKLQLRKKLFKRAALRIVEQKKERKARMVKRRVEVKKERLEKQRKRRERKQKKKEFEKIKDKNGVEVSQHGI